MKRISTTLIATLLSFVCATSVDAQTRGTAQQGSAKSARQAPGASELIKQRPSRGTIQRAAFRRKLLGARANTAERVTTFFGTNTKARNVTEYIRTVDEGVTSKGPDGRPAPQQTALQIGGASTQFLGNGGRQYFPGVLAVDGIGRIWEVFAQAGVKRLWEAPPNMFPMVRTATIKIHDQLINPKSARLVTHVNIEGLKDVTPPPPAPAP
jgi:hypothetical protein